MVCRQCGIEIADKALICYKCGTATQERRVEPVALAPKRSLWPVLIGLAVVAAVLVAAWQMDLWPW